MSIRFRYIQRPQTPVRLVVIEAVLISV
jgi:diketogulonate reductase-like aldo/keto reductase